MAADPFYQSRAPYTTERGTARAIAEGRLTEADARLIRAYISERRVQKHITEVRATKIYSVLTNWRRIIPVSYADLTDADVYEAVTALETATSIKGKPFSQNSKHDWIRILKPFLLWGIEEKKMDLSESKIKKIAAPPVDYETKDDADLLTTDEIEAMLRAARTSRDRALLSVLYESAGRIAEIGRLRWRDVAFDEHGAKIWLSDRKTRKRRFSRLTMSAMYLATWKNDYNGTVAPDAPVFIDRIGHPMTYIAMTRTIDRAVKTAGIAKPVKPHLLRSTRITHMIAQNYQESIIMETAWGNVNTAMLRTYLKLSERDMDHEFLRRAGVEPEDEGNARRLERTCGNCHKINPSANDFCGRCGQPLTDAAHVTVENLQESIIRHKDVLMRVLDKVEKGEITLD